MRSKHSAEKPPIGERLSSLGTCFLKEGRKKERRLKMTPKRIVFLAIALLFAVFVFQNAEIATVQFLFWKTEASRALILVGTFLLGLVVGWLTQWLLRKERKGKAKSAEQ
jgi:uncharacterized integral membrane protein